MGTGGGAGVTALEDGGRGGGGALVPDMPEPRTHHHHPDRPGLAEFVACALVALAASSCVLALVVADSIQHGRLRLHARVDDVIYFARGVQLAQAWQDSGFPGVCSDWSANTPHSPLLTIGEALAQQLFGPGAIAAYLPALGCALAFVWFIGWMTARSGAGPMPRILAMLAACAAPFVACSMYNFKPDYACGMCTAAGCILLSLGMSPRPRARRAILAGMAFGLAALAKPAALPFTLGMLGLACACVLLIGRDLRLSVRNASRLVAIALVSMLVVAGWHFALGGWHTLAYTYAVLRGEEADTWRYGGSFSQHALYYLTGPGGRLMLGDQLWVALLLNVAGLAAVLFGGRSMRAHLAPALRLASLVLAAWLVPTIMPAKIAQFAATFHVLLWLSAAMSALALARWWSKRPTHRTARRWQRRRDLIAMFVVLALCLASTGPTFRRGLRDIEDEAAPAREHLLARSERVQIIVEDLLARARLVHSRNARPANIAILMGPGEICPELLTFAGGLRNQRINAAVPRPNASTDDIRRTLDWADIVVCADPGGGLSARRRVSPEGEASLRSAALNDARFRVARTIVLSHADRAAYILEPASRTH